LALSGRYRGIAGTHTVGIRNQAWVSIFVLSLGLVTAWHVSHWLAAGDLKILIYAGLAVALGAVSLAILDNWRTGFYFFLFWLLFEDLIRKYMGNNMAIYFGKDVLVGITYVSLLIAIRRGRAQAFRPPFLIVLSLFFWLAVLQIFNPDSPSVAYGLLGMKLYFYYVPLMFVGYALADSGKELHRFLTINAVLAAVIAILGIIQGIAGPSFLNPTVLAPDIRELSTLYRYAPISGQIVYRPNSVFVSDGRFASYMLFAWILMLGSAGYLVLSRRRRQWLILGAAALTAVAALMSAGRGMFINALGSGIVIAAGFLWGAPWRWGQGQRAMKAIRRGLLAAGLGFLLAMLLFPQALGARWAFLVETLSPLSPASELRDRAVNYSFQELQKAFEYGGWWLGHGTGTTSLGVQYITRLLGKPRPPFGVESGYGNLLLEFGILGLSLWLLWTAALLVAAWKVVWRLKQTAYFPLAFAIFWFSFLLLVPFTYGGLDAYQNYVFNAYFWLLVGVLFRLPSLVASQPNPVPVPTHGR
jgi:hypothetical protein